MTGLWRWMMTPRDSLGLGKMKNGAKGDGKHCATGLYDSAIQQPRGAGY
jgi:hypothetical protein